MDDTRMDLRGFQTKGPVYTTVEKCSGRSRILAQDKVNWGSDWYGVEDGDLFYFILKSYFGVPQRSSFLFGGWRVARETWPPKNSASLKCGHVG